MKILSLSLKLAKFESRKKVHFLKYVSKIILGSLMQEPRNF
jgi:hypothetical protein